MAEFDEARGVVARILYDGLGTAGKTASLRRLRELLSERSGEPYTPEESAGRTVYFDWLEVQAGRFDDHELHVELMTLPGQSAYAHRRYTLLRSSDAVIAVVDSTPRGLRRAKYAMCFLEKVLGELGSVAPPLVIQAHKQDLDHAAPVDEVRRLLGLAPDIPVVGTSAATGEGLRSAFVLALRAAREHIRRGLGGRPAAELPRFVSGPEALLDRMREEERSGAELEGERVLAEVLDQMDGKH